MSRCHNCNHLIQEGDLVETEEGKVCPYCEHPPAVISYRGP